MSNPQKAAGTAWESKVTTALQGAGLTAYRVAQKGANDVGDIHIRELPDVIIEAKRQRKYDLAGWVSQANKEAAAAGAAFGTVWAKRFGVDSAAAGYVIMDGTTFMAMLNDLAEGRAAIDTQEQRDSGGDNYAY